jgi:hypothetical protein
VARSSSMAAFSAEGVLVLTAVAAVGARHCGPKGAKNSIRCWCFIDKEELLSGFTPGHVASHILELCVTLCSIALMTLDAICRWHRSFLCVRYGRHA